jgi:uncharacterized protein YgiM (DUF1202 family)
VVVLKHYRRWYWVQLPSGAFGWAVGAGIGKGSTSFFNNSPFVRPQVMASVRVDALDVRSRPGLQAPVVGAVYSGQKLHVYGHWREWLWVTGSHGALGWVRGNYVAGPGKRAALAARSHGQLRAEALKSAFEHHSAVSGTRRHRTGPVSVNVRNAPSTSGVIVDLIPPGGGYRILRRAHGWAHVLLPDGTRGYASLRVLPGGRSIHRVAPRRSVHGSSLGRGPVLTAAVLLHAHAALGSAVLGMAAPGTHVRIIERSGKWLRVRLPRGRIGYVYRAYVKR